MHILLVNDDGIRAPGIKAIAAGAHHTVALHEDGTVRNIGYGSTLPDTLADGDLFILLG